MSTLYKSCGLAASNSGSPYCSGEGGGRWSPNIIFAFFVILDFFYWTYNWQFKFDLFGISLTYLAYIGLIVIYYTYNKSLLYLYICFSCFNLFFIGSLDSLKTITILFFVIHLSTKLNRIYFNEKFINFLLVIIAIEMFIIINYGSIQTNVFGDSIFFKGLAGSYKEFLYSLNLPLFVLGLCMGGTKSKFKKFLIFILFNVIFYLILKSYARFGMVYILLWVFYLLFSMSGLSRHLFWTFFIFANFYVFHEINQDVIYFLFEKSYSGRDVILANALHEILNNPAHFIFGIPGASGSSAFEDNLLIPDLGSIFISLYDYGIFGLFIFLYFIFRFIHIFFSKKNNLIAPIFIFVFIAIIDISSSNFFAFTAPYSFILWAAFINNRNFTSFDCELFGSTSKKIRFRISE